MESKFKPGVRVRGRPSTEDAGKIGTITEEITWINHAGKPINRPKDAPKWAVLFDGEKTKKQKREEDLEII